MIRVDLQALCQRGQEQLMQMNYAEADSLLAQAEAQAYAHQDFDTLSRLYLPLQEARRQRRLRCGEGTIRLDLLAESPRDRLDGRHVVENHPQGQLLVAGWGSIQPALEVRNLAREHHLYVETFLAAVYPQGGQRLIAIVPLDSARLPPAAGLTRQELFKQLPPSSLLFSEAELPRGSTKGNAESFGQVLALWERLHQPFLADADAQADSLRRIDGYRRTIQVDAACELAHQKLSDAARQVARGTRKK